ncbi:hypothetical protein CBL_04180 [Carabus blaptoides fortunei]
MQSNKDARTIGFLLLMSESITIFSDNSWYINIARNRKIIIHVHALNIIEKRHEKDMGILIRFMEFSRYLEQYVLYLPALVGLQ